MIRWTGPAPWNFEFDFPGSLTSTFLTKRFDTEAGADRGQDVPGGALLDL